MVLTLPGAGTTVSASDAPKPVQTVVIITPVAKPKNTVSPAVRSMDGFLKTHKVSEENRARLAKALVASAKKYDLNPRLLASVMIVESRGNQFAVSGADAVGLMQIHLPTWGETVDRENINLFKIEDNIDLELAFLRITFGDSECGMASSVTTASSRAIRYGKNQPQRILQRFRKFTIFVLQQRRVSRPRSVNGLRSWLDSRLSLQGYRLSAVETEAVGFIPRKLPRKNEFSRNCTRHSSVFRKRFRVFLPNEGYGSSVYANVLLDDIRQQGRY
jgi:hypothetical protein